MRGWVSSERGGLVVRGWVSSERGGLVVRGWVSSERGALVVRGWVSSERGGCNERKLDGPTVLPTCHVMLQSFNAKKSSSYKPSVIRIH